MDLIPYEKLVGSHKTGVSGLAYEHDFESD